MPALSLLKLFGRFIYVAALVMILLSGTFVSAQTASFGNQPAIICGKVTPDSLFHGVELAVGQDSTECVTVTNCGDAAEVFDANVGLNDYIVTPKSSPPIPPDSSFTFCITFQPRNVGDKHTFFFVAIDSLQYYIPLAAATPCAYLGGSPTDYGIVTIGQKIQKTLTVLNNGDYLWKPGAGYFFPDNGVFTLVSPNLDSLILQPHQTISITIQYNPKAFGKDSASLYFPDAGPCGNDLHIPVSGEGGCAVLSTQTFTILNTGVGETTRFTIPVSNTGNMDYVSGTGIITGTDSASFNIISIVPSIIPSGTQSILTLEFTPMHSGNLAANLSIPSAGLCGTNLQISLLGKGICSDIVSGSTPIQKTTIGHKIEFTVTIMNTGNETWASGLPILSGQGSSAFKIISIIPDSILPGNTMNITLEFDPADITDYSALLTFPNEIHCQTTPLIVYLNGKGIGDGVKGESPDNFFLDQNYPNPFSGQTSFEYTTPKESDISLTLCDINGRAIRTLLKGRVSEGKHIVYLKVPELPVGTYIIMLECGSIKLTRELILIK